MAEAQGHGFSVVPSFTAVASYDDNILFTAFAREAGMVSHLTAGLQATYQPQAALTLLGDYSLGSDIFREHPEFNSFAGRQQGTLGMRYVPRPTTTLSLTAAYLETQAPAELVALTGLEFGRRTARGNSVAAGLDQRITSRGTLNMHYNFQALSIDEGGISRSHGVGGSWSQQITRGGALSLGYEFQVFDFGGAGRNHSHLPTVGWTQVMRSTTVSLRGGPRISPDSVSGDVSASIANRFRRGQILLAYGRSRTPIPSRLVDSETLVATASYGLGRYVVLSASPGLYRTQQGEFLINDYRVTASLTGSIKPWLSLQGGYQFVIQETRNYRGRVGNQIPRTIAQVGLTLTARRHAMGQVPPK